MIGGLGSSDKTQPSPNHKANGVSAMTDIQITSKWSDVKPKGFYVYLHRRATDGSVFYVGKGSVNRAWKWRGTRSQYWINIANKSGVSVDIHTDNMTENCAFTLEKILIHLYGIDYLCNFSNGGEGVSGMVGAKHWAYNHTIYDFINKDGGIFSGTAHDFGKCCNLSQPSVSLLVSGKRMSHKGWRFTSTKIEDTGNSGERSWKYGGRIFTFYHKVHGTFTGTRKNLIDKYKLPKSGVDRLISGRARNHAYGWYLDTNLMVTGYRTGSGNPSYNHNILTFINKNGGRFTGTQYDFRVKFSLDISGVSSITRGVNKTYKGWYIK